MSDWTEHLRERLAPLRLSPAREAEIVEELSQHLDERHAELRAAGSTEAEARRLALEELLEPDTLARHMRPLRQAQLPPSLTPAAPRSAVLGDLWHDVRYSVRMLRKQPGFAAAAILTLALGIGANTAIFSLVNATLLRRLPVANSHRLYYVYRNTGSVTFSYPMYAALRDANHVFDGLAAWGPITVSLNSDNTSELVNGIITTGNLFDVLGITAGHGRLLSAADDAIPGGHPVVVISHDFWQTRFGGRADVVGREVRLNGHVFTIVGVTPPGFPGPQLGAIRQLYVPMMMQAVVRPPSAGYSGEQNPDLLKRATGGWLGAIGRLAPGTTVEQARAELQALATTFARTANLTNLLSQPLQIPLVPVDEGDPARRQQMRSVAWLLSAVAGAVLLIACANIANLLLSRNASRRRELAVRLAVGASGTRLVRQLLTESVLLSSVGGLAGLGLAWIVVRGFQAAPPPPGALPLAIDFSIDERVLLFSLALSFVTGLVFGVAPALKASRPGLVPALKDASADSEDHERRFNLKRILVVAEVSLSMVLLVAAGLFVRSLQSARAIDPGVDVDKLVSAPLSINLLRYTRVQGREFYRHVVERVEQLPGVESASVARVAIMGGGSRVVGFLVEGGAATTDSPTSGASGGTADATDINANVVGPGFFRTVGIRFVAGRDFSDQDIEGRPPVAIVNETAVRTHLRDENPIGKRVRFDGPRGPWREIIGVVRDSKYGALGEGPLAVAYLPVAQNHETGMTLYVRTSVPPASLASTLRREIQTIEPNLPVPNIQTMAQTIGTSLYAARMGAWLLGVFGGLALLLAAVGVYGVLAFSISRRTREMGIRLALGADSRDVFLLVVRDGMLVVSVGIILGLAGGIAGTRSLASFLYDVSPSDLPTYVATTVILSGVALIACVIPARRAMRVPPMTALRQE